MANTIIESIGIYLPEKAISSEEIVDGCTSLGKFPLARLTGIKSRRVAGMNEYSIDLAKKAIKKCIEYSRYNLGDIDLLICCNISRYDGTQGMVMFEPGTAIRLKAFFHMNRCICFDVSNACAGMFTGIHIADTLLQSGAIETAMIVSGEYITHLTETAQKEITNSRDEYMACLTVGDSGAALVLKRGADEKKGFVNLKLQTDGSFSTLCIGRPTDKSHGGYIMTTDSVRIHEVALRECAQLAAEEFKKVEWTAECLHHCILHQTGRMPVTQFMQLFNSFLGEPVLNANAMVYNVENRGNTSSTSHFVALWDSILNGTIKNNENIMFAIIASGINVGVSFYVLDDLPERINKNEKFMIDPKRTPVVLKNKMSETKRNATKVRIASIGVTEDISCEGRQPVTSLSNATEAARKCLNSSGYTCKDIETIIFSGVYRDEFICEPAIAALLAGTLEINANSSPDGPDKAFVFDIFNGSIGFLNACYIGMYLINLKRTRNVLVCTSEINNEVSGNNSGTGVLATGAAMILDMAPDVECVGFDSFFFRYFTDHIHLLTSYLEQIKGKTFLKVNRHEALHDRYLSCIHETVCDYQKIYGMDINSINAIIAPLISEEFVDRFRRMMKLDRERIVTCHGSSDYFTSSIPYGLYKVKKERMVKRGDTALIITVGTGIQVGCCLYRF